MLSSVFVVKLYRVLSTVLLPVKGVLFDRVYKPCMRNVLAKGARVEASTRVYHVCRGTGES